MLLAFKIMISFLLSMLRKNGKFYGLYCILYCYDIWWIGDLHFEYLNILKDFEDMRGFILLAEVSNEIFFHDKKVWHICNSCMINFSETAFRGMWISLNLIKCSSHIVQLNFFWWSIRKKKMVHSNKEGQGGLAQWWRTELPTNGPGFDLRLGLGLSWMHVSSCAASAPHLIVMVPGCPIRPSLVQKYRT